MNNVVEFRPRDSGPPLDPPTKRQQALGTLLLAGVEGVIWRDLSARYGWHHGSASGVLSTLHKDGMIARLTDRRAGCYIYVLPNHVGTRSTRPHGTTNRADLITDVAAFLRSLPPARTKTAEA
jgi:hypothetical protein